jgi:hypothetical protein
VRDLVDDLLRALSEPGQAGDQAALALGLLIERERVRRPAGDDDGIRAVLGDRLADRRLMAAEVDRAIAGLARYIDETTRPGSTAVWALGKSYDERFAPTLLRLLDRALDDESMEETAYEALGALINSKADVARDAVVRAAETGHGRVRDLARGYLDLLA